MTRNKKGVLGMTHEAECHVGMTGGEASPWRLGGSISPDHHRWTEVHRSNILGLPPVPWSVCRPCQQRAGSPSSAEEKHGHAGDRQQEGREPPGAHHGNAKIRSSGWRRGDHRCRSWSRRRRRCWGCLLGHNRGRDHKYHEDAKDNASNQSHHLLKTSNAISLSLPYPDAKLADADKQRVAVWRHRRRGTNCPCLCRSTTRTGAFTASQRTSMRYEGFGARRCGSRDGGTTSGSHRADARQPANCQDGVGSGPGAAIIQPSSLAM
jgi:hypothetical protein